MQANVEQTMVELAAEGKEEAIPPSDAASPPSDAASPPTTAAAAPAVEGTGGDPGSIGGAGGANDPRAPRWRPRPIKTAVSLTNQPPWTQPTTPLETNQPTPSYHPSK